jgi:hypothetical protein
LDRDADLDALIERAKSRGRKRRASEPRATAARYDRVRKLVVVKLDNGALFGVPPRLLQGLEEATSEQLSEVAVSSQGALVVWPKADVAHGVANLLAGVFGAKWWLREHAARAGRATSDAKAAAARRNGTKGGRPRKTVAAA